MTTDPIQAAQAEARIAELQRQLDSHPAPRLISDGPQWRDIESAPKDGTYVLLFFPGEPPTQFIGCWLPKTEGGCWVSGEWDVEPTDWMPLPTPPAREE